MGIFFEGIAGSGAETLNETLKRPNELLEAYIIDELSFLPESAIQEFVEEGGVADQLIQEGKLRSKNTLVKMAKKDDLERRNVMACLQMAKEDNCLEWKKLVKAQQMKNKYKARIIKKYNSKAARVAKAAQQEYLHGGPKKKGILPEKFRKFRGEDMTSQ